MRALFHLALSLSTGLALVRSTLGSPTPLASFDPAAPQPAPGVWALMTGDCAAPASLDLSTWPACAQPIGFTGDEVAILQRPEGGNRTARTGKLFSVGRTRYVTVAPDGTGGGALVQVEAPGLTSRSWIYLALTPAGLDAAGRFVEARAFPLPCPVVEVDGVTKQGERCRASTLLGARSAALGAVAPVQYDYTMRLVAAADEALPSPMMGEGPGMRVEAPRLK